MKSHLHPHHRPGRGRHRGFRGHRGHRGRHDAATRRARLESYQRDLEQELADVAERIRRLDEAS